MPIDKSKFLQTFKTEAEGYLTALNQGLVRLEKEPKNAELLSELFRVAHTLKGAARMMGFDGIQKIAHGLEDLLGALQQGTKEFDPKTADQSLAELDRIKAEVDKIGVEGASEDLALPVRARGLSGGRSESDERVVPPDSNAGLLSQAMERANQGRYREAIVLLQEVTEADQLSAPAHFLLGVVLEKEGKFEEAIQALRRAVYVDEKLALVYYYLGNLSRFLGKKEEARREYRNCLRSLKKMGEQEPVPLSEELTVGVLLRATERAIETLD